MGLVALAAGLIAGLVLPTPNAVNRGIGPAADRLRARTRQAGEKIVEKGKRVAHAAVHAVKDEAQAQGLTPEHLREKLSAVAERAEDAGRKAARREGLVPTTEATQFDPQQNNPSVRGPAA